MKRSIFLFAFATLFCFSQAFAQDAREGGAELERETQTYKVKKDGQVREFNGVKKLGNITPEARAQKATDRMTRQLELSEAQQKEIYSITLKSDREIARLRDNRSSDIQGFRSKIKQAHKSREKAIGAVLNSSQTSKYNQIKREMRERRGNSKSVAH